MEFSKLIFGLLLVGIIMTLLAGNMDKSCQLKCNPRGAMRTGYTVGSVCMCRNSETHKWELAGE